MLTTIKKAMRRFLLAVLSRFNYTLAYTGYSSLGNSDSVTIVAQHIKELLDELGVDLVLDVGANLGQYRDLLRDHVGYDGLIVSFEPTAALCDLLRQRQSGDSNWTIQQFGLGNENGEKAFNVSKKSGWSSFLEKDENSTTKVAESVELDYVENVQIRKLDDVISEIVPDYRDRTIFLKVDAQGFDLDVLRGGQDTLTGIPAVQTELEFVSVYSGSPVYLATLEFLNERGFFMTLAAPIWKDEYKRIGEMDVVFRTLPSS